MDELIIDTIVLDYLTPTTNSHMETLTIDQIRAAYPNEWVLVGNPDLGSDNVVGSVVSKLVSGIVLYHSKDKREIGYKTAQLTENMARFTCIYTGDIPQNRRFWL
jgi:hypothetical protein